MGSLLILGAVMDNTSVSRPYLSFWESLVALIILLEKETSVAQINMTMPILQVSLTLPLLCGTIALGRLNMG
jgi:hypothetical protein